MNGIYRTFNSGDNNIVTVHTKQQDKSNDL